MKKNLLIMILLLGLLISSCSNNSVRTVVYEMEDEGIAMSISLETQEDRVLKQTNLGSIEYYVLGVQNKEEAEEFFGQLVDEFQESEGIDFKLEFTEDSFIEKLTIDYTKANPENFNGLPGVLFQWEGEDVSLEKIGNILEAQGFIQVK